MWPKRNSKVVPGLVASSELSLLPFLDVGEGRVFEAGLGLGELVAPWSREDSRARKVTVLHSNPQIQKPWG